MNFFELMNQIGKMWKSGEIKENENPKDNDLSIFHFVPSGMFYAANNKKKKHARATISLPPDVCGECISDLYDWEIKIIAIKRDKLKTAVEKCARGSLIDGDALNIKIEEKKELE